MNYLASPYLTGGTAEGIYHRLDSFYLNLKSVGEITDRKLENEQTRCPARLYESENIDIPTFFECDGQTAGKITGKITGKKAARCRQDNGKMPATNKEDNKIISKEDNI